MPNLSRGRIIWATFPDPQGLNPKSRPAVVVLPPADASPTAPVRVVGVSTQIGMAPAEVCVELPWHRAGHPRTGLTARCEAVGTWLATITVADVEREIGQTPPDRMLRLLQILSSLPPSPPPRSPAPPSAPPSPGSP